MKKQKLTQEEFEKILKTNSRENPLNIDNYDKQSVINCREKTKAHLDFYIIFKCEKCKKINQKNIFYKKYNTLNYISYCKICTLCNNLELKYGKGITNVSQIDFVKEKRRKTNLINWKTENVFQNEEIKHKISNTIKEKYDVNSSTEIPSVKQAREKALVDKKDIIAKKRKETNLEKYGCENVFQNQDIIDKIKPKRNKTMIDRYNSFSLKYLYIYNTIHFDSSWELAFYIYHKDKGHQIHYEPTNFSYKYNKQYHYYFPDFKVDNRYYEIKGEQFIERYKNGNIKRMICPYDSSKNDLFNAKYKCMKKHKVIIITLNEIQKYLNYIIKEYGNLDYLEQFRIKKNKNSLV